MIEIFNTILYQPLFNLLIWLYNILGQDIGLAIIGLTVLTKLVLYPLSLQAIKAQKSLSTLQPKIEELKTLKNECLSCQDEIRAILQEQIANMEQEHQRLRQLVVEEQSRKGIIGWIVGLFK